MFDVSDVQKILKKPKFEVDKIWCYNTNGKFELGVYRSSSWACKVVDGSTCLLLVVQKQTWNLKKNCGKITTFFPKQDSVRLGH